MGVLLEGQHRTHFTEDFLQFLFGGFVWYISNCKECYILGIRVSAAYQFCHKMEKYLTKLGSGILIRN